MTADQLPDPPQHVFEHLGSNLPIVRVLWMVAMGENHPHLMSWRCDAIAINTAITDQLLAEPLTVEFPYMLTDKGRRALEALYGWVSPRRDLPDFKPFWEAVTLR